LKVMARGWSASSSTHPPVGGSAAFPVTPAGGVTPSCHAPNTQAGQEPLLDVDDLLEAPHPDPLACQTYVFELMRKFSAGGSLAHNVTGKLL
jgi:hypothetical protein